MLPGLKTLLWCFAVKLDKAALASHPASLAEAPGWEDHLQRIQTLGKDLNTTGICSCIFLREDWAKVSVLNPVPFNITKLCNAINN